MKMERGYYWLHLKDEPSEVVEIDGGEMYRCGSDVTCLLVSGVWVERCIQMDVVSISGPILPETNPAGIDRSDAADARRMRWLLDGHGYFMEEEGLCGPWPCDAAEQDIARAAIDREMVERPPITPSRSSCP